MTAAGLPPVVDAGTWQRELDALRARENGRGTEQLSHTFALIDLLPYGRQEEWQDSPEGWPQSPAYSGWAGSEDIAALYGSDA